MPFFSIIIATYNAEHTIRRCLASLAGQRFQDMEVRIMDGGSTDATLERVAEFDALPLHVTSEPDSGLYDALNKGLRAAHGRWVNILGADDELLPGALDEVKATVERWPADIYAGYAQYVNNDTSATLVVDPCDFRALAGSIPFNHNAMFASRQAYDTVGCYDLSYRIAADAQWVHRAIKRGMHFQTIPRPLVRFHCGGLSSNAALILPECYRLILENFPCLNEDEAKSLLFMSKGWKNGAELEAILARHPAETELARAARAALNHAPHCAQRILERELAVASGRHAFWRRVCHKLARLLS